MRRTDCGLSIAAIEVAQPSFYPSIDAQVTAAFNAFLVKGKNFYESSQDARSRPLSQRRASTKENDPYQKQHGQHKGDGEPPDVGKK
jgi:hypothetical protein